MVNVMRPSIEQLLAQTSKAFLLDQINTEEPIALRTDVVVRTENYPELIRYDSQAQFKDILGIKRYGESAQYHSTQFKDIKIRGEGYGN